MSNNNKISIILGILLLVSLSFIFKQCTDIKNQEALQVQNIKALTDKSKQYEDAYNNILAERAVYVGDDELLRQYDSVLYVKLKEFKKGIKSGDVITVTNTNLSISGFDGDSTETKHTFNGNGGKFSWIFESVDSTHTKKLQGYTDYTIKFNDDSTQVLILPEKTRIILDYLSFGLETYFVKNSDGSYSTMARTPYKNINLVHSGAILHPEVIEKLKTYNFSVGVQSGLGYGVGGITPYIGLGISYNLYSF